jgi:monovalent cation:H+ antiporter-2, CPA2 family
MNWRAISNPSRDCCSAYFLQPWGSTINFSLIGQVPGKVFGTVALIMGIKALVLAGIGRFYKLKFDQNMLFTLLLSQVGEFAFVLLASSRQMGILDKSQSDYLMAAVTISMMLTPILLFLNERFIAPHFGVKEAAPAREADTVDEQQGVILAGFGHFGSTLGRFLRANGVNATILDNDSDRVGPAAEDGFQGILWRCHAARPA